MNETTIEQILGDDFLWTVITNNVTGKRKLSRKGFLNVDCPMCVSRGESADHRQRCGIVQNYPGIGINCYNCGFKTKWVPGELLNRNIKDFLIMVGVSEYEVSKINHKCFMYRNAVQAMPEVSVMLGLHATRPTFVASELPRGSETLHAWAEKGCKDRNFLKAVEYIHSRGEHIAESRDYYWSPSKDQNMNERVIIPFAHYGKIVGYSARSFSPNEKIRKYIMNSQENYLFNCDVMEKHNRQYIILVEGVLDAIAIDGVALLGANLNSQQVSWVKSFGKKVILLPDRDKRGQESVDLAVNNDWFVSFPSLRSGTAGANYWDDDVKDAAAATQRHGRLWTVHSIIEASTNKKMEISVKRSLML